jgi:hypothetical protein
MGKPKLTLSQEDLSRLDRTLGKNIKTSEDLIQACERLTTCNVEGAAVTLEPGLLTRLKSRCPRGVAFPEFIGKEIIRGLHAFVGW